MLTKQFSHYDTFNLSHTIVLANAAYGHNPYRWLIFIERRDIVWSFDTYFLTIQTQLSRAMKKQQLGFYFIITL